MSIVRFRSLISFSVALLFLLPVMAQDEVELESTSSWFSDTPAGFFGVGVHGGEGVAEGAVQFMSPVYVTENGAWLINPRFSFNDEDQEEFNLGLVYRHLVLDRTMIIGGNIYYDVRWPGEGSHFSQLGLGLECLTEWVDARANYYWPEDKKDVIDQSTHTSHAGVTSETDYEQWAAGNAINERQTTTTYDNYLSQTYVTTAGTLQGFDAEIGAKLPGLPDSLEVRLFGGYYQFDSNIRGIDDISGFKARLEARVLPALYLDAQVYEDNELFGSDYLIGARLQLPLNIANLASGKNPFVETRNSLKPGGYSFENRLAEAVIRDPHVQLRGTTEVTSKIEREAKASSRKEAPLLTDVIFVDDDNTSGVEDGTKERPFNTVQEGVDASEARAQENVYVFSGDYTENVLATHSAGNNLNLIGAGLALGTDGGFAGTHPLIDGVEGSIAALTVSMPGEASIRGFRLTNSRDELDRGRSSRDSRDDPGGSLFDYSLVGALINNSADVTFSDNIVENTTAGLIGYYDSDSFDLSVRRNQFNNLGIGVGVLANDASGNAKIVNNTFGQCVLGAAVVNTGHSYVDATIKNNIIGRNMVNLDMIGPGYLLEQTIGYPSGLTLPSIGGIAALSMNGAGMDANIKNNTLNGDLVGIVAGAIDSEMYANIQGNTIIGGGLSGALDLLGDAGLLPGIVPEGGLPTDLGLAGIGLFTYGDAFLEGRVRDNNVQQHLLGALALNIGDSDLYANIKDNTFRNNLLGVVGANIFGDELALNVKNNTINGGGLAGPIEGLGGPEIQDFGLLGAGLVNYGDGESWMGLYDNQISDHLIGALALDIDDGNNGGNAPPPNVDPDARTVFELKGNTIQGSGVSGVGDLIAGLMGADESLGLDDAGLAGVIGVAVGEEAGVELLVNDNTIENHLLGVTALGLFDSYVDLEVIDNTISGAGVSGAADLLSGMLGGGGPLGLSDAGLAGVLALSTTGSEMDAKIKNNQIDDHLIGVLGAAILDGGIKNFDVIGNTINGAGARDLAGLLMSTDLPGDDFGLLGIGLVAYDDSYVGGEIKGNTVNDNLIGIGALSADDSGIEVEIKGENVISNSLIGIAGLALDDSFLGMNIKDNTIIGGLNPGLPTGAGVLLLAYDDSELAATVKNNQITDSAGMGLWVTAGALPWDTEGGDPSEVHVDAVGNTISGHGLMGVLAEGYGEASVNMTLKQNTIVSNNVSGLLPGGISSVMAAMAHDDSYVGVKVKDNVSDGHYLFFDDPGAFADASGNGNVLENLFDPALLIPVGINPPDLPFQ